MVRIKSSQAELKSFQKPVRFTLSADSGWRQRFGLVSQDIQEGVKLYRLIWALAFADIRLRYRGSAIGPFWLTISTGVQIGAMAFIYAGLFHVDFHSYFPFLCVSLIIWNYLSSLVTDGCSCFIGAEGLIKGTRLPFFIHATRSVIRNTVVLAHNLPILILVFLIARVHQSFYSLTVIPWFLLWIIDGIAISMALGAICARFRDIPQIVASIMQIAFFVTPIMWSATIIRGHARAVAFIHLNPFVYILDVIRNPLLGLPLSLTEMGLALAISVGIIVVSLLVFTRTRGRIAFWV